jgi:hypothetical protein
MQYRDFWFFSKNIVQFPERDPSPVPRRLVKTPAAVHPLPWGEGYDSSLDAAMPRCATRFHVDETTGLSHTIHAVCGAVGLGC